MRTTLAVEDDVYTLLEDRARERRMSLKAVVNESLRAGLNQLALQDKPQVRTVFSTPSFDLSGTRYKNLDNIQEILAVAEGDQFI